jgi:hypothetical protein
MDLTLDASDVYKAGDFANWFYGAHSVIASRFEPLFYTDASGFKYILNKAYDTNYLVMTFTDAHTYPDFMWVNGTRVEGEPFTLVLNGAFLINNSTMFFGVPKYFLSITGFVDYVTQNNLTGIYLNKFPEVFASWPRGAMQACFVDAPIAERKAVYDNNVAQCQAIIARCKQLASTPQSIFEAQYDTLSRLLIDKYPINNIDCVAVNSLRTANVLIDALGNHRAMLQNFFYANKRFPNVFLKDAPSKFGNFQIVLNQTSDGFDVPNWLIPFVPCYATDDGVKLSLADYKALNAGLWLSVIFWDIKGTVDYSVGGRTNYTALRWGDAVITYPGYKYDGNPFQPFDDILNRTVYLPSKLIDTYRQNWQSYSRFINSDAYAFQSLLMNVFAFIGMYTAIFTGGMGLNNLLSGQITAANISSALSLISQVDVNKSDALKIIKLLANLSTNFDTLFGSFSVTNNLVGTPIDIEYVPIDVPTVDVPPIDATPIDFPPAYIPPVDPPVQIPVDNSGNGGNTPATLPPNPPTPSPVDPHYMDDYGDLIGIPGLDWGEFTDSTDTIDWSTFGLDDTNPYYVPSVDDLAVTTGFDDSFWSNIGADDYGVSFDMTDSIDWDTFGLDDTNPFFVPSAMTDMAIDLGPLSLEQFASITGAAANTVSTAAQVLKAAGGSTGSTNTPVSKTAAAAKTASTAPATGNGVIDTAISSAGKLLTLYTQYQAAEAKASAANGPAVRATSYTLPTTPGQRITQPDGSISTMLADGTIKTIRPNGQAITTPVGGASPFGMDTKTMLIIGASVLGIGAIAVMTNGNGKR